MLLVLGLSGCALTGKSSDATSADGPATESTADGGRTEKPPLPDVANTVAKSGEVSFTAEYKPVRSDGKVEPWKIVLIHQAPVVVAIRHSADTPISQIWSPTDTYTCGVGGEAGKGKCEHKGPSDALATNRESWAAPLQDDISGAGAVLDPFVVLHDLEQTIWDNKPEVIRTTRSYAGQSTSCVKTIVKGAVSSIRAEHEGCFTSRGIVTFANVGLSDKQQGWSYSFELTRYSESVDPAQLKPPADAEIVEA